MQFEILNRWSGKVQFTAEIDCDSNTSTRVKIGLAVKWADQSGAVLRGAVLRGADNVPAIEALDTKILAAIEAGGKLDMGDWHRCKTTHCRAGWAITLAGEAGAKLEADFGSAAAGALIYAKSYPDQKIANFYTDNDSALADIRRRAATDPKA